MNEFEYILLERKIDEFTTIKQHEECARELYQKLRDMSSSWGNRISVNFEKHNITTYENIYKVFKKVVTNYKGKSGLPDFIRNALNTLHSDLASYYKHTPPTYDRFIDVFKYDVIVQFGYIDIEEFKVITLLIGDKIPPFNLEIELRPTNAFRTISSGIYISTGSLNNCLEIEELKRTLPNDIKYTLIEKTLSKNYNNIKKAASSMHTTKETMPNFVEHLKHIVMAAEIACERINRETFG